MATACVPAGSLGRASRTLRHDVGEAQGQKAVSSGLSSGEEVAEGTRALGSRSRLGLVLNPGRGLTLRVSEVVGVLAHGAL